MDERAAIRPACERLRDFVAVWQDRGGVARQDAISALAEAAGLDRDRFVELADEIGRVVPEEHYGWAVASALVGRLTVLDAEEPDDRDWTGALEELG